MRKMNLEELTDRVVRSFKAYAHQKGLILNLVVGQDIQDMEGDPDRIEQVLTNLVGNAIKFTDSGSITVYVTAKPGWQEIRVADTGRGISSDDMNRIFEKFRKGKDPRPPDNVSVSSRQGMGLGLFISKSIIERHGGRISVESKPGEGSTFTIRLPWAKNRVASIKS